MSTRSKTRSPSKANVVADTTTKSPSKQGRPRRVSAISLPNETGKENKKSVPSRGKGKGPAPAKVTRASKKKEYCLCKQPDDGTPMVHCVECKDWYHFRCVGLSEKDADDISVYVCSSCSDATGRRTVMEWEGPDAVEESSNIAPTPPREPTPPPMDESDDEDVSEAKIDSDSDEAASEDEYVVDENKTSAKTSDKKAAKRRTRRLSVSSESSTEGGKTDVASRRASTSRRGPGSPVASGSLKRKPQHATQVQPSKRQKGSSSSASEDPTRTYCLKKLQEVFIQIFLKYPRVPDDTQPESVLKNTEDLTDPEKHHVEESAKAFATELEQCVYDLYSEPDGKGKPSAGGKYKERFRMLTFNLGKPDRVMIHKRIASSNIMPKELSLMSSTDLADEETKQSIKTAEKEALAHSILQKTVAPRAKITHKGMVDIEDVNNDGPNLRDRERERELEEEERRERERTARLRAAQAQKRRASSASQGHGSVPPDSPMTPHPTSSWGGPPPLPLHAIQTNTATSPLSPVVNSAGSPVTSMFSGPSPDFNAFADQLELSELINIDEDSASHEPASLAPDQNTPNASPVDGMQPSPSASADPSSSKSPTGISPFAASGSKSEASPRLSFDLNALWTAPKPNDATAPTAIPISSENPENKEDTLGEADMLVEEADDQDFDMFLEKDLDDQSTVAAVDTSPEAQQVALDALPPVWSGKISMPLDSSVPRETPVVARQVGGRHLEANSSLWRTLFPTDLLRIDGRVPVPNSAQYLLQMRMNSTKELISVILTPASTTDEQGCKTLSDYLIGKNRHGLVFPWGQRPKEYYPGRELYIIPLLASEPLPDYMELLDDLCLPTTRKKDALVGIWVLNKGKLAPPPTPTPTPHVPTASVPFQPPVGPPLPTIPATGPSITVPTSTPHISTETLAAEVASLTPEQIQLMLRTLSAAGTLPPAAGTPQASLSPPSHLPINSNPVPPHAWPAMPNYPSNGYGSPHPQQPSSPYTQGPYPRYDQGSDNHDRGGRGWGSDNRGRERGRGRARGRDRDFDDQRRPVDSGWGGSRGRGNWDPPRGGGRGGWN